MKVSDFESKHMLKSPWGDVVLTSSYGYMIPYENVTYTPVLVHVNLEGISQTNLELVYDLLSMAEPPLFLFTYGDKSGAAAGFLSTVWAQELQDTFNAVISLFNSKVSFFDGYGTCFNNLPEDLEELLDTTFQWGKYVGESSRVAESLGSLLNKPTVSLNTLGKEEDFSTIRDLIRYIPEYPSYDYKKAIADWEPVANKRDRCYCCNKKRAPLKFFVRVQKFLCSVCERKIKVLDGGITLQNTLVAMEQLKKERVTTRQANLRKSVDELCFGCTCGEQLVPLTTIVDTPSGKYNAGTWYCNNCKQVRYIKGHRLYTITNTLGRNIATQYELRHGVPVKQVKTFVTQNTIKGVNDIEQPDIAIQDFQGL